MKADRSLDDVITGLVALERDAGTLATDALRVTPSFRFRRFRREVRALEERLAEQMTAFMNLDADLVAHASTQPRDINSLQMYASRFQGHFGVRDSVRGLLAFTGGTLGELRNELVFRLSTGLSLLAIVISVIGLFVGGG